MARDGVAESGRTSARSGAAGLLVGSGAFFLVHVCGAAITLVAHALLARGLGVDAYGELATSLTVLGILLLGATLGFDVALVRFVAQYVADRDWARLVGLRRGARGTVVVTGIAVGAVAAAGAGLLSARLGDSLTTCLLVAAALLPLNALVQVQQAELRGLKRVVVGQVPVAIVRPAVLVVAGAVMCLRGEGTWHSPAAMVAYGVGLALALVWGLVLLRRHLPAEIRSVEPRHELRSWLRVSLPLSLVSGMRVLLHQVDILLVAALLGTTSAGIYAVASRIARLMSFGLLAANAVASPMIAELFAARRSSELQRLAVLTSWISFASSLAIGVALVVGQSLVLRAFGAEFVAGRWVFIILAASQLVNATTGPVGHLLNLTGHQDANARIFGVVTLLNVVLNGPAILLLGMEGAALVTAVMIAFKAIWTWREAHRRTGVQCSVLPLGRRIPGEGE